MFIHTMLPSSVYRGDNNLEEALKWYNEMKEKCVTPDSVTYCLLIPLICKKVDLDKRLRCPKKPSNIRFCLAPTCTNP